MKRLLGARYQRPINDATIGGIPVDSEYIVPTLFALQGDISANSVRFAALMRALAERNGGSFVGLNSR